MKLFIFSTALLTFLSFSLTANPSESPKNASESLTANPSNTHTDDRHREPFNYPENDDNRNKESFGYPDAPIYYPPYSDTDPGEVEANATYRANQHPP